MPVNRAILQAKWVFKKALTVPVEKVKILLLRVNEGTFTTASAPFLVRGSGDGVITKEQNRYVVQFSSNHKSYLYVDHEKSSIAIKSQWWYCGVYTILNENETAVLMLEVFNVAPKYRWAANIMELARKKKHRNGFYKMVMMLEEECSK